jgi:hypothetical protein
MSPSTNTHTLTHTHTLSPSFSLSLSLSLSLSFSLNLIRLAGDYVSEEVWYRIVQVVINTQEVQGYAAKTCFEVRGEMVSKSVCVCIDRCVNYHIPSSSIVYGKGSPVAYLSMQCYEIL